MGLNFFERIFARSEIKKAAAENKETFLDAANTDSTTPQQMAVIEAYYDASTEIILDNVDKLNSDSTPEDVLSLMMDLVVKDISSEDPGVVSKQIQKESGLDFGGQNTPDNTEDDFSKERFVAEILPRVYEGYRGVFEKEERDTKSTSKVTENTEIQIVTTETQDMIKIGEVSIEEYFSSFADPVAAQQRISAVQDISTPTQATLQIGNNIP